MSEYIVDACVPIAARLVATVRDYGPEDVAAVLAMVPEGRMDALAIVLAAMVDPDKPASELLAWTGMTVLDMPKPKPHKRGGRARLPREHGTERGYYQHRTHRDSPCVPCKKAHALANPRQKKAS